MLEKVIRNIKKFFLPVKDDLSSTEINAYQELRDTGDPTLIIEILMKYYEEKLSSSKKILESGSYAERGLKKQALEIAAEYAYNSGFYAESANRRTRANKYDATSYYKKALELFPDDKTYQEAVKRSILATEQ